MLIEPQYMPVILSVLGTTIVAGLGFILRTLNSQNQTLAVLQSKLETAVLSVQKIESVSAKVEAHEGSIKGLQADMSRVWGIYDAWTQSHRNPIGEHHER